jgi:shikimate dehydrogenase
MSDQYAVIGNPISQSKSPRIHAAFALEMQQNLSYVPLEGRIGGFVQDVDAFRAQGGRGMNVTAPFKLDAFAYATDLSPRARLAGAVNALKFEGDKVLAENFDGIGLVRDMVQNLGCPVAGKRVLILGAGGATRGALLPFLEQNPAALHIANRDVAKAHAVIAETVQAYPAYAAVLRVSSYAAVDGQFDIVLNATSASLYAECPPLAASAFAANSLAYELAYGKGLTPFLKLAQSAGVAHIADGVGMLVEQAAEAFAWWRGVRPSTAGQIVAITVPLV